MAEDSRTSVTVARTTGVGVSGAGVAGLAGGDGVDDAAEGVDAAGVAGPPAPGLESVPEPFLCFGDRRTTLDGVGKGRPSGYFPSL